MLAYKPSSKFKQDVKRCNKRGWNLDLLEEVLKILIIPSKLPKENNDHPLRGEYKHYRECHIDDDWVLIYRIEGDELYLARTGSHSDLFKNY